MILFPLALAASPAFAADPPGEVVTTELRTSVGDVKPALWFAVDPPEPDADPPDPDADPPQPDYGTDGRTAWATTKFAEKHAFSVVLGLGEPTLGVDRLYYVDDAGDRVIVWGDGAVDRFFPPDPCSDGDLPPGPCRDGSLPPGPCFELFAVLRDGTELGVWITITTDGGYIDPASAVGFNPQPEPPGDFQAAIELDLTAYARDGATLDVALSMESRGEPLPLN